MDSLADLVNLGYFGDYLSLGGLGFVVGVVLPFGFRIVGYLIDGVLKFMR